MIKFCFSFKGATRCVLVVKGLCNLHDVVGLSLGGTMYQCFFLSLLMHTPIAMSLTNSLRNFCAGLIPKKTKPPSLVSLCIGVIGRHLEDIIADLDEIAINLPVDIKVAW